MSFTVSITWRANSRGLDSWVAGLSGGVLGDPIVKDWSEKVCSASWLWAVLAFLLGFKGEVQGKKIEEEELGKESRIGRRSKIEKREESVPWAGIYMLDCHYLD
jgi:hypothetical protein